jgi:hypothetical protein
VVGDSLDIRAGKLYRCFGLCDEIIETAPSFIGIEVPTVFGPYPPRLALTTNVMIHANVSFTPGSGRSPALARRRRPLHCISPRGRDSQSPIERREP